MARKPRVYYPGAVYHVTLRGNAGQAIFLHNRDRTRFYLLLQEGIERFRHRIHAFCLMSNHVHLAIQVGDVPLSRIIQNLSFRYTRWINWRQGRSGRCFQRENRQPGGPMGDSSRMERKGVTGRSTTWDPGQTVGYSVMTHSLTEFWRKRRRGP